MELITGDARSLDYSSYGVALTVGGSWFGFYFLGLTGTIWHENSLVLLCPSNGFGPPSPPLSQPLWEFPKIGVLRSL